MSRIFCFVCIALLSIGPAKSFINIRTTDCGPYGFVCDGANRVRLCDGDHLVGPAFNCPSDSLCNEESTDVCENRMNYIDPVLSKTIRCHRNERVADPSVENCKGYILCIPNKNRVQGIKFKCSGNTVFNGFTRTCTSPEKYKCPIANSTKTSFQYFGGSGSKSNASKSPDQAHFHRPIDCKSYKFAVTQEDAPTKATYFCPSRPVVGESRIRCTIFSNYFCITLERDYEDQFIESTGAAYRRPRTFWPK
ncbi:uncharacterized protein LOC121728716 [Aricia agestis]|uniref:uncharacterized protein LOC121728716 n=1 Tax=Aricia agestis TaxID=91739 RepID=UPI001C204FD1|nr:uncharacterized protein LOC121728716 [Aricia agestis]